MRTVVPFIILGAILWALLAFVFFPAPSNTVRIAAGVQGGAYIGFAQRYQRILTEQGLTVDIIETAGSLENLRLLENKDVDIALVQGGIASPRTDPGIKSLGGFFAEPVWLFVSKDYPIEDFGDLREARMAIGEIGSGQRSLALLLQSEWGGDWAQSSQLETGAEAAAEALLAGELDAVIYIAAVNAPFMQDLLRHEAVDLIAFERAPALARRQPALTAVTLLQGVIDLDKNQPDRDIHLVAPVAQLLTRQGLGKSIQSEMLDAAYQVHSSGSLLFLPGTFPDANLTDLPLTSEAKRYHKRGQKTLRALFSFRIANFFERSWMLGLSFSVLLLALFGRLFRSRSRF